jgi:hypothetical protein
MFAAGHLESVYGDMIDGYLAADSNANFDPTDVLCELPLPDDYSNYFRVPQRHSNRHPSHGSVDSTLDFHETQDRRDEWDSLGRTRVAGAGHGAASILRNASQNGDRHAGLNQELVCRHATSDSMEAGEAREVTATRDAQGRSKKKKISAIFGSFGGVRESTEEMKQARTSTSRNNSSASTSASSWEWCSIDSCPDEGCTPRGSDPANFPSTESGELLNSCPESLGYTDLDLLSGPADEACHELLAQALASAFAPSTSPTAPKSPSVPSSHRPKGKFASLSSHASRSVDKLIGG